MFYYKIYDYAILSSSTVMVRVHLDAFTTFREAGEMNEALTIKTERGDDIPLLLAHMQRMGLVEVVDRHVPTHGNRVELSLGWVSTLWLTHVLSQADHRRNHVQSWAEQRLETLRGWRDATLEVRDRSDDRLAEVLRGVSDETRWREFEQEWTGQMVRVSDLRPTCVRLDSTTVSCARV
jgi:hypothetical protein